MSKNSQVSVRNWMSCLLDSLVDSGAMPSWEAIEYLNTNLIGEAPNSNLHLSKSPYETTQQFLQRVYNPLVEAATRAVNFPPEAMIHMFMDISLMGNSSVLVVYFPGHNAPHQLLLLDGVRAWDLLFPTTDAFNRWAQERYQWILDALKAISVEQHAQSAELVFA